MSSANRRHFTVSNTPGTGALSVSAAVTGPWRTMQAGDNGKLFDLTIIEGTEWEVARNCTYTHGTTSFSRGTFEESSTGSAVSFTSAATVFCTESAVTVNKFRDQTSRGVVIVRNDGTATLSIAASTFTKLTPINSEEYDPNGWWDNSAQRFQPTRAGRYLVFAGSQLTMSATASPQSFLLVARKNGADFAHLARGWVTSSGSSANVGVSGSCVTDLNGSTDYIEPFCWQNGAGANTTVAGAERQFFMAVFLSEV